MAQARKLAASQDKVVQLSLKAIDALWAKAGRVTDPAALRRLLDDAVPALVRRYGGMAGTVAAEWYQAVRRIDGGAGDGFEALPSDVSGEALDRAAESARWAAQPLFDAKSADPRGEALSRVREVVERHVRQAGQDTLARNAERDPRAARYAIVPTGARTCAWCVMLASRGGVYKSKASARGSVHAHCDCQALPDFGSGITGYDPGEYYDLYEKAVADAGGYGASEEDILAALRRNGGVSDSPQPPKAETGSGGGGRKPPKPPKATAAAANDGPERWADENAVFVRNREGETVCISNRVIGHVIDGDAKGGGHSAHATKPGKSHFPASWSDDKIKGEIEKTVAYPDEIREIAPGKRILTRGEDGTLVTVVVVKTKKGWKVRTAYPEVDDKRGLDT